MGWSERCAGGEAEGEGAEGVPKKRREGTGVAPGRGSAVIKDT